MKHRLTHIDKVLATNDGKYATLRFLTESAPPFTLEIETARLDEIIG